MEEQQAQQDNSFLKGRQIAYMFYNYLKISGTGEALLDFNDARLRHQAGRSTSLRGERSPMKSKNWTFFFKKLFHHSDA